MLFCRDSDKPAAGLTRNTETSHDDAAIVHGCWIRIRCLRGIEGSDISRAISDKTALPTALTGIIKITHNNPRIVNPSGARNCRVRHIEDREVAVLVAQKTANRKCIIGSALLEEISYDLPGGVHAIYFGAERCRWIEERDISIGVSRKAMIVCRGTRKPIGARFDASSGHFTGIVDACSDRAGTGWDIEYSENPVCAPYVCAILVTLTRISKTPNNLAMIVEDSDERIRGIGGIEQCNGPIRVP